MASSLSRPPTLARVARVRVLADVTPLRQSSAFRRLFAGQLVSFLGTQIAVVAVAVHVY